MKQIRLLSFGEIVWDVYPDKEVLGGAPLNLAAHAALQGCEALLLSAVGSDRLGQETIRQIREMGVRCELIAQSEESRTGICRVSLSASGIPSYALAESAAFDFIPFPALPDRHFDVLAFGSLALRSAHNRETVRRLLTEHDFSEVYTDLNIRPPFYSRDSVHFCLSGATVAKISDEELPTVTELLYGRRLSVREAICEIAKDYPQLRLLLITKGAEGSLCYDRANDRYVECPAEPAKTVSTVGAGDSFGATFLTQLFRTGDLSLSLRLASQVSAHVVSHKESIPTDMKEFLDGILSL